MKIHFFHTNDVHSHFEEFLQIATQMRRVRAQALAAGDVTLTFDIGDHADRKRMETEGTWGRTNAALLREVQYDAWTIGNNEGLTLPISKWEDLVNEGEVPTLVANLFDAKTGAPYSMFEPYLVLERQGLRIAVIGITVPFFDFYKMYGVQAEHPRDTFARILPEIKRQDVDLVVLLSHLGLSSDKQIAEEIEGIDIIFGGHTHNVLEEPLRVNNTLICQTGCYAAYFGHVEVELDEQTRQVVGARGRLVKRDPTITPDRDLADVLSSWQARAAEQLTEVVADLANPLGHELVGDSPLAHLLTDGMRELTGAPIAVINGGMFNHGLIEGPVTKADLLTCFPSPNLTCVVEITGAQMLSLLKKGLDPAYVERVGMGFGFRGHFVGGLQVSGLSVTVNMLPDGGYDVSATHQGQPLDPEQYYEVAANDYLYFSRVYEEFRDGRHVRFYLPFLRELLGTLLQEQGSGLQEAWEPRWHLIDRTQKESQKELETDA